MTNLVPVILLLLLTMPAFAQEKTDDELLRETVVLSKEVKEFGKVIGIEPTKVLSKSAKEQKTVFIAYNTYPKTRKRKFVHFRTSRAKL